MKSTTFLCAAIQIVIAVSAHADDSNCDLSILVPDISNYESDVIAKVFRPGEVVTRASAFSKTMAGTDMQNGMSLGRVSCGAYAVVVFVDEDGNGSISHGLFGPNEPIGFSGSYRISLTSGLPTFEKLQFQAVSPATEITITLN